MESLPKSLVPKIAAYLSSQDLVACSAVSKKWREKFNIDAVWRPRCHFPEKYYKIQAKYKDMIICPPDNASLEPLCTAREHYVRDQCLRFNWRAGLFTGEEIKLKGQGLIRNIINSVDDEGNYWLFINTTEAIEVWNLTNRPSFQSIILKNIPNAYDTMCVLESKVLLIFADYVQVYNFEHPKYEMVFQCYFHFDDDFPSEEIPGMNPRKEKPFDIGNQNMKHLLTGHILIGFTGMIAKSVLSAARMHVWNMDTLVKLHRSNILHPTSVQTLFDDDDATDKGVQIDMFEGDSQHLLIVLQTTEDAVIESLIFLYSISQRGLRNVKRSSSTRVLWTRIVNNHVLVFGLTIRSGFVFSLVDINKGDISTKIASRLGVDAHSQVLFRYPIFVQTANTFFSVEAKDEKLTVRRIFEDQTSGSDCINICCQGHFMFSKTVQGPVRLWDVDNKCWIRDLPKISEKFEINSIKGLEDVDIPPKISCVNNEKNSVYVLSFW